MAHLLSYRTERFFVLVHPHEAAFTKPKSRSSLGEEDDTGNCSCGSSPSSKHHIFLDVDCDYTRRILIEAFSTRRFRVTLGAGHGMDAVPLPPGCQFQWAEYERIDWSSVLDGKHGASSYCIRKGLSRKAQLAYYVKRYTTKNPGSVLTRAIPETQVVDTWAVWDDPGTQGSNCEGLAELIASNGPPKAANVKDRLLFCLDEARRRMEIAESEFEKTDVSSSEPIWILKGSTTNKGSGIYIIHVFEQLVDVCWSESDIREWVLQRYIASPLLLRKRKFHIRAYAFAVSSLRVYLARGALALCSGTPYSKKDFNTLGHITNTAFQGLDPHFREEDCVLVWDEATISPILLKDGTCNSLDEARRKIAGVTNAMQSITGELFRVYESEFGVFSPIEGCFEHYGLDFLVDERWNVYLLEANPGPDFRQTGDRLSGVVRDLMSSTIDVFFASTKVVRNGQPRDETRNLVCVYDNADYGRSRIRNALCVRPPA